MSPSNYTVAVVAHVPSGTPHDFVSLPPSYIGSITSSGVSLNAARVSHDTDAPTCGTAILISGTTTIFTTAATANAHVLLTRKSV